MKLTDHYRKIGGSGRDGKSLQLYIPFEIVQKYDLHKNDGIIIRETEKGFEIIKEGST